MPTRNEFTNKLYSKIVRVNTRELTRGTTTNFSMDINRGGNIDRVRRISLVHFKFHNTVYNVNVYNNKFIFEWNGTQYDVTLPNGQYDMITLMADLQTAVNAITSVDATPGTCVISIDGLTQRVQIDWTLPLGKVYGRTLVNNTPINPMAETLGYIDDTLVSASNVADGAPSLNGLELVNIYSDDIFNGNGLESKRKSNLFCSIGVNVPFGFVQTFTPPDSELYSLNFTRVRGHDLTSMSFRLTDENDDEIDFQGKDVEMLWKIYYE